MAISDFLNFAFLTPKISKNHFSKITNKKSQTKNHFFRKMITKSKIFKIFKKPEYML